MRTSYKDYGDDIKYIMLHTRNVLLALGAWPFYDREISLCKRVCKCLLISISCTLLFCGLVPGIFRWIIEKTLRARLRMTTILVYGFMSCSKYGNFIIRQDQIRRCLKHIEEDWKMTANGTNARILMLESARTGRYLVAVAAAFLYTTGMSLRVILPFAKRKMLNQYNVTIRPLPSPTYLFSLDIQASPVYEVLYTIQLLCGLVSLSIATGACGLLIVFVMHACGQLKILRDLMNSFVEKQWQNESEVQQKLAHIVEHQTRLRSFLQLVEHTLQQICLIEVCGITLIMCVLGYCIIMEWESSNSLAICSYFVSFSISVVTTFIFCYIGEQLATQTDKVATTACDLKWYLLPNGKAREVVLVMIMSNMPIKITAGKIIDLSFKSFGDILKTAAAYLNMLRSVSE